MISGSQTLHFPKTASTNTMTNEGDRKQRRGRVERDEPGQT